jgi:hypothetical protein
MRGRDGDVSRRSFLGTCGVLAFTLSRPARAGASTTSRGVPLSFAVAVEDGVPVRDAAWIDAQLGAMEGLYVPLGLRPVKVASRTLARTLVQGRASSFVHMETRADRDSLADEARPGVVNVFVVGTLRDVDEPSRMRRGVHWRNRKSVSLRYVILAAEAMPTVLAHEMGHYFGLGHSLVADNLMSYERTGGPVTLDAAQARIIQDSAREAFRSGEIVALEEH